MQTATIDAALETAAAGYVPKGLPDWKVARIRKWYKKLPAPEIARILKVPVSKIYYYGKGPGNE